MKLLLFALLLLCVPVLTFGQTKLKEGTYTTSDGSYSINVRYDAKTNTIVVVEPNKTSEYTSAGDGEYSFTNPKNEIEYRLAIVDATTLEAFKPGGRDSSTKLYHSGGVDEAVSSEDFKKYQEVAEKYLEKMKSDSDDAQLWAFCAASANARSTMNAEGFESYAKKAIKQVATIMEDKTSSPCTDAMPADLWNLVMKRR
jgi:hypothetical protein